MEPVLDPAVGIEEGLPEHRYHHTYRYQDTHTSMKTHIVAEGPLVAYDITHQKHKPWPHTLTQPSATLVAYGLTHQKLKAAYTSSLRPHKLVA